MSFRIALILFTSLLWGLSVQASSICFVGGWPSVIRSGQCQPPWNADYEDSIGIKYDQNFFCGARHLFRCNPILYGPGNGNLTEENSNMGLRAGACVPYHGDFAKANELCAQRGEENRDEVQRAYENDPVFRERYDHLTNLVISSCGENADIHLCSSLVNEMREVHQAVCEQSADYALNPTGTWLESLTGLSLRIANRLEEQEDLAPGARSAGSCSSQVNLRTGCRDEVGNCSASSNNRNQFRDNASTRSDERRRFESTGGCPENYSCTGRPVGGGCEEGMALVCSSEYQVKVCVDLDLRRDETGTPQGFQTYNSCQEYCRSQGKRLMTNNEFLVAGLGTESRNCLSRTDRFPHNPMPNRDRNMNNPRFQTTNQEVLGSTDRTSCVSAYGINDMVGVLGQWVDGGERTYQFNGGLWAHHGSTLFYRTTAHPSPNYQDYSIGCRCAADPRPNEEISLLPVETPPGVTDQPSESLMLQAPTNESVTPVSELAPDRSPSPPSRPREMSPSPEQEVSQVDRAVATNPVEGVRDQCQVEGTNEQWRRNCEALYSSDIPEGMLDYTLHIMRLNSTRFAMDQCYNSEGLRDSAHPSMNGHTAESIRDDLMSEGFRNKCQFIMNDTDDRIRGENCRGRMYYIDLCQGEQPVVTRDYFNIGTGTCRRGNGFTDGRNIGTTVLGAFLTIDRTFDFQPAGASSIQPYNNLRRQIERMGGPREATAVGLIGMQNTNNLASATGKHMHVSPYRSSLGCPSLAPENYYMIQALAENGPSLVVNYAREGMEEPEQCISE